MRHHAIGSGRGSGAGGVRRHSTEGIAEERRGGGSRSGGQTGVGSGRRAGVGSVRGSPYRLTNMVSCHFTIFLTSMINLPSSVVGLKQLHALNFIRLGLAIAQTPGVQKNAKLPLPGLPLSTTPTSFHQPPHASTLSLGTMAPRTNDPKYLWSASAQKACLVPFVLWHIIPLFIIVPFVFFVLSLSYCSSLPLFVHYYI